LGATRKKWAGRERESIECESKFQRKILAHLQGKSISQIGNQIEEELKVMLSLCLTNKHYAMIAYGSVYIDPHFLDLGTSWR
jgi:hypothetical protein